MITPNKFKAGDVIIAKNKYSDRKIGIIQRVVSGKEFYSIMWKDRAPTGNQVLESSWWAIDTYYTLQQEPNDIIKEIL